MPFVTVGKGNTGGIEIYYEDHGSGPTVVLSHGWRSNDDAREPEIPALLTAGYRAVLYDRQGFGRSSRPTVGYSYEQFAEDLRMTRK